jgi:signal transduction histidine kinase
LLESLAQDVSFAMEAMEGEAQRRRAEGALVASEERLRHLAARLIDSQEKERNRIALELHDDLGQSLMVLTMQLRAIAKMVPSERQKIRDHCNQTLNYVYGVIENVRRLARDMHPSSLEDLGLPAALRHLTETFNANREVDVLIEVDDIGGFFAPHEEINIYRIFQEALTNIAKYAQATQVTCTIRKLDGRISFRVEDNGRGFDMDHILAKDAPRKGLGLVAMEERVRMMGGELEIWSQEGKGTRISFSVPVAKG